PADHRPQPAGTARPAGDRRPEPGSPPRSQLPGHVRVQRCHAARAPERPGRRDPGPAEIPDAHAARQLVPPTSASGAEPGRRPNHNHETLGVRAVAKKPNAQTDASKIYRTTITTNRGTIVMDLDPQLAPETVNNFVGLARDGYYDGLTFHRVVPEFVIQGGDPEGTGRGGPGYKFNDEPVKGEYTLGAVAMANAGPNTNGSQFFICIDDCRRKLSKDYNLFGYVVEGTDVATSTQVGDGMQSVAVEERSRA